MILYENGACVLLPEDLKEELGRLNQKIVGRGITLLLVVTDRMPHRCLSPAREGSPADAARAALTGIDEVAHRLDLLTARIRGIVGFAKPTAGPDPAFCSRCHGSGEVPAGYKECPDCDGSGMAKQTVIPPGAPEIADEQARIRERQQPTVLAVATVLQRAYYEGRYLAGPTPEAMAEIEERWMDVARDLLGRVLAAV